MFLLIDTCFWSHSEELFNTKILDLREILNSFRWGFTEEVQKEIQYHNLEKYVPKDTGLLIPISKNEINQFQKRYPTIKEFDLFGNKQISPL